MRKITTAITAAALAFSMMAAAVPAAAVTGYDSAYAGESAFVNITGGQTQNFQVFFANTGTTSWVKGTGTQVDLAACLEDKVTCNAQDASEATWNSGWLSAVRYASTSQTTTPPGSLGTFSYNITAPTGVAAGIYHFNGDLVVASTGERIHPEGYFQDANTGVSAGAATITTIVNSTSGSSLAGTASGTAGGGDSATITGSGIVCNPTFPTVSFGGTNAVVTSCGATQVTLTTPAHAAGSVTVTLTNPGAGPSNGLTWTYTDTTTPKFNSFTISAKIVTVTWSEPVCQPAAPVGTLALRWTIHNVSDSSVFTVNGDSTPLCNTAKDNGVTSSTLTIDNSMPNGAFVELTLNTQVTTPGTSCGGSSSRNENYQDAAGNCASAPQSRQATATAPESVAPTLVSASGNVGSAILTLNFSEPVQCVVGWSPVTNITMTDFNSATTDPTVTGYTAGTPSTACGAGPANARQSFKVDLSSTLPSDRQYTVTVACTSNQVEDVVGNDLACPATVIFTTGAGDFTPPTIVDARMVANVTTTDFADPNDSFSLTFSEAMTDTDESGSMKLQDQDGTVLTLDCAATTVSCTWNTAKTTVTVTLQAAFPAGGPAGCSGITCNPPLLGFDGSGTTPGMQVPFNVTTLTGSAFTDTQGNSPNVLGSADRLVDFE